MTVPSQAALMNAVRKSDTEVAWILVMESEYLSSQATIKPLHARWATRSQVRGVYPEWVSGWVVRCMGGWMGECVSRWVCIPARAK